MTSYSSGSPVASTRMLVTSRRVRDGGSSAQAVLVFKRPMRLWIEANVNYRKFDRTYMNYIFGKDKGPKLPVTVMATDSVQLPFAHGPKAVNSLSPIKDAWQRWNDYGIGLLLEGGDRGRRAVPLSVRRPPDR